MDVLAALLSVVLTTGAAVLAYLASPAQKLSDRPPRPPIALITAALAVVAATALMRWSMGPAAAAYCVMTVAMIALTATPFAVALGRRAKGRR